MPVGDWLRAVRAPAAGRMPAPLHRPHCSACRRPCLAPQVSVQTVKQLVVNETKAVTGFGVPSPPPNLANGGRRLAAMAPAPTINGHLAVLVPGDNWL